MQYINMSYTKIIKEMEEENNKDNKHVEFELRLGSFKNRNQYVEKMYRDVLFIISKHSPNCIMCKS